MKRARRWIERVLNALVAAALIALSIPANAANYTALWWNPAESGWGINVNHQGDIVFATLFTYAANGTPMWLVMSNGARQGSSDAFAGDLYRTTGPVFNAEPFTPLNPANVVRVGSMTVSFSGDNAATLAYDVDGVHVSKSIQKQVYGSAAAVCDTTTASRETATNYQDLWFNAAESGWGLNVTHQDQTLFATLFTYGSNNQGLWLVMSGGTLQADGSYSGDLYRTSGPAFNAPAWGAVTVTRVGTMRLRFAHGAAATLDYSVDGVNVHKSIVRQEFSSPRPLCSTRGTPLPPVSDDCGYSYNRDRVLTYETRRIFPGTPFSLVGTLTVSYGGRTTFQGQAAEQFIAVTQDTTGTNTTHAYVQESATDWTDLGALVSTPMGDTMTNYWQPPYRHPKQWSIGQVSTYTGALFLVGNPAATANYVDTDTLVRRETLTTPAGTFDTCVHHVVSTTTNPSEVTPYDVWVAPGIGPVKQAIDSNGMVFSQILQSVR